MRKADLKEKARLLKNEYQREWRKNNRERARQHQENFWIRKAAKELEESNIGG